MEYNILALKYIIIITNLIKRPNHLASYEYLSRADDMTASLRVAIFL